jgi:outer membrane protein assembly factor BamB
LTAGAAAQSRSPSSLRLFPVVQVWTQTVEKAVTVPPAFAGHFGFLPVEGDQIVAYDLETGTSTWTAHGTPVSTPAVGAGMLFVAERDAIMALSQDSGDVVWRVAFSGTLAAPLVWDSGWLIAADDGGTLLAFRASDGELIWRHDLQGRVHARPALAADRVYAAMQDGRVVSLDVATGEEKWSHRLGDAANDMLALDERIYVGSDDNFFYCLMASNGEIAWRWRTGGDVIGVPVVDDHRVYFVSKDNVLRGLDRHSGSQRWKRGLPGRPTRGIVASGDLLLVSGLSAKVSAFAMKDGAPAGDLNAPGELAATPYVTDVRGLPEVVVVARDIAKGTRLLAMRRSVDPQMNTPLPQLPNPITIAKPAGSEPTGTSDKSGTSAPTAATPTDPKETVHLPDPGIEPGAKPDRAPAPTIPPR